MLLIVIENLLDRLDTRIVIALISLSCSFLVPIENLLYKFIRYQPKNTNAMQCTHSTNKGRDQGNTSLSTSNSLTKPKKKSKVTMNVFIPLQFTSGLNTLPRRCNLDQNAVFGDTKGFIESNQLFRLLKIANISDHRMTIDNRNSTFALVASLSKERRASTSVETRPGMIARISLPNSTS